MQAQSGIVSVFSPQPPETGWVAKLLRRLLALGEGRYMIVLTVRDGHRDWSVTHMGKVEG